MLHKLNNELRAEFLGLPFWHGKRIIGAIVVFIFSKTVCFCGKALPVSMATAFCAPAVLCGVFRKLQRTHFIKLLDNGLKILPMVGWFAWYIFLIECYFSHFALLVQKITAQQDYQYHLIAGTNFVNYLLWPTTTPSQK